MLQVKKKQHVTKHNNMDAGMLLQRRLTRVCKIKFKKKLSRDLIRAGDARRTLQ